MSTFRYKICIVDNAGRGSEVTRRKTLCRAKRAAAELAPKERRPLGIWDYQRNEYIHASFLP